jgi:ribonuclease HII
MLVVGIDEVGRGCWAGPLAAAAVVLPEGLIIPGLDDSKKLSRVQRDRLAVIIREQALAIGVGWVPPEDIDSRGITRAVKTAMTEACDLALSQLPGQALEIIIDGNYNYLPDRGGVRTLIGADGLIPEVSAASIIAKVARDNYMSDEAHILYPEYGFDRHVGYGTRVHLEQMQLLGVTPLHRLSYKPVQRVLQSQA